LSQPLIHYAYEGEKISNTSKSSAVKQDELNLSEVELLLVANLFAAMTRADGIERNMENLTAKAFLEEYNKNDIARINEHYHRSVENFNQEELNESIQGLVCSFTEEEKLKLIKSLCMIAFSDGEIHSQEQELILTFMDAMDINQSTVDFATMREHYKIVDLEQ